MFPHVRLETGQVPTEGVLVPLPISAAPIPVTPRSSTRSAKYGFFLIDLSPLSPVNVFSGHAKAVVPDGSRFPLTCLGSYPPTTAVPPWAVFSQVWPTSLALLLPLPVRGLSGFPSLSLAVEHPILPRLPVFFFDLPRFVFCKKTLSWRPSRPVHVFFLTVSSFGSQTAACRDPDFGFLFFNVCDSRMSPHATRFRS